ncbi:MAG TPA: helix-turn-helix transcriptional regulator [Polyangiaceae bacterium]
MPFIPSSDVTRHISAAKSALRFTNKELGEALGISERTIVRWWSNHAHPSANEVARLAARVHPIDASLAAALAAEAGTTLAQLGLAPPAEETTPAVAALPPSTPPRPFPPATLLVEAVVGTAANAMQVAPSAVRGAVLAAFACARGLGLTIEEVESALTEPTAGLAPAAGAAGAAPSASGVLPPKPSTL